MDNNNIFLLFIVDDITFALNISEVQTVIRAIDYNPITDPPEYVIGLINYHGDILPLIDFRKRFNLKPKEIELSDKFIICKSESRHFAIIVDDVLDTVTSEKIISNNQIWNNIDSFKSIIKLDNKIVLLSNLENIFLSKDNEAIKQVIRTFGL